MADDDFVTITDGKFAPSDAVLERIGTFLRDNRMFIAMSRSMGCHFAITDKLADLLSAKYPDDAELADALANIGRHDRQAFK